MPDKRVTYRRRHSYRTRGNKLVLTKTPGGKLTGHYKMKNASAVCCGDTGRPLIGVKVMRPAMKSRVSKRSKSVARAYGGCLSGGAVRDRIIRAFLVEEQKIVKKVLKNQAAKAEAQ